MFSFLGYYLFLFIFLFPHHAGITSLSPAPQFYYTIWDEGEGSFQLLMIEMIQDSVFYVSGKMGFTDDQTLDPHIVMDTVNNYMIYDAYLKDANTDIIYRQSSTFAHRYVHKALGGKGKLDIYEIINYQQNANQVDFFTKTPEGIIYHI